jgi:hypothetical protein
MGLNDRPAPLPMRGRHWILPLDRLVTQSGGPLEASAGQEDRTPSGQPKRHGGDSEATTATGCRLNRQNGSARPPGRGSRACSARRV